MAQDSSRTTDGESYNVSEKELKLLAAAESKARSNGVCYLRFTGRDDGGVTVTEETDHVQELEEKVNE